MTKAVRVCYKRHDQDEKGWINEVTRVFEMHNFHLGNKGRLMYSARPVETVYHKFLLSSDFRTYLNRMIFITNLFVLMKMEYCR